MNQYISGKTIKELREKYHLTQAELAAKLNVSDKTISKWETMKGYPDISLLKPISEVFGVSLAELFAGTEVINTNLSANMMKSKLYVCPICGNIINSMGEMVVHCHGIYLSPCIEEVSDDYHKVSIEIIEDEYYITINHDMNKDHYISFIGAMSQDKLQLVKLYPEGNAEARFKINGVKKIMFYCNRDGLFSFDPRWKG